MARAKPIHVQAKVGGMLVFDKTVSGRANERPTIMECFAAVDRHGGIAVMRHQVVGARGWGYWQYEAGAREATRMRPAEGAAAWGE